MLKTFSSARTESTRTSHSGFASAKPAEAAKEAPPDATKSVSSDVGSKLIVGPNIKLKGAEITDCEILVVEGRVEASMNSRDIRIAEGGVFSGKAEIDVAEVHGHFEGELTARKRLVIYATGKVSGTIRYGALMVEEGGMISGNIAMHSAGPSLVKLPEDASSTTDPVEEISDTEQISGSAFARGQRRQG